MFDKMKEGLSKGVGGKKTTIAISPEDKKTFDWMKSKYETAAKKKLHDSEFFHAIVEMVLKKAK